MENVKNNPSNESGKLFRDLIQAELKSGQIAQAKKEFIRAHFGMPMPVFLRPIALGFTLGFVALLIMLLRFEFLTPKPVAVEPTSLVLPRSGARVHVQSVSSDVGSAMVYQKSFSEGPLTVVWVFTPLEVKPLTGFTGGTKQ